MRDAFEQAKPIVQEEFTTVGEAPPVPRSGSFGDPEIIPVMTRTGYQDHLVTRLQVARTWYPTTPPAAKGSIVRTQTGRTMFVQMVDFTHANVFTFILTDREV